MDIQTQKSYLVLHDRFLSACGSELCFFTESQPNPRSAQWTGHSMMTSAAEASVPGDSRGSSMQMIVPSAMGLLLVFHIEVDDCHLAKTQGPGNLWHVECAGFQQTSELLRRHRSTEVVSLDLVTIVRLEK